MERWELVNDTSTGDGKMWTDTTERLRIPGGWLYRVVLNVDMKDRLQLVFVPRTAELEDDRH